MDIKDKLKQYYSMVREITRLEDERFNIDADGEYVSDVVKSSWKTFPYIQHSAKISGYVQASESLRQKRKDRITKRISDLQAIISEVEDFIESIDDSTLRQAMELRYIHNMSWRSIAIKLYKYPCEDTPRKMVERYFEKE